MAHGHYGWDTTMLQAERQEQAGTGDASITSSPTGHPTITQLLWHLSRYKALAADRDFANAAIAPLVRQLRFDQELAVLFTKFGWHPEESAFTTTLDLPGLKGALQKYKYIRIGQLGSGSYGVVHKAVNRETNEVLAVKKVAHSVEQGLSDSTIREISTLQTLRHENIVRLKDIIATANGSHVHLVLEFLDYDLRQYLDQCAEASDMGRIKSIVFQILRGVRHAHSHSVMHRDLKPQNILIGRAGGPGQVKITDFGLARCFLPNEERAYTERVVTLYYRAPELLLGAQGYTPAVDLWSVGCILAEMVNFEPLFKSDTEIGLLFRIFERLGTPTPDVWRELPGLSYYSDQFPRFRPRPMRELVPRLAHDGAGLDLLTRLLTYDPGQRITASQALQHPWFQDVRI